MDGLRSAVGSESVDEPVGEIGPLAFEGDPNIAVGTASVTTNCTLCMGDAPIYDGRMAEAVDTDVTWTDWSTAILFVVDQVSWGRGCFVPFSL